MKTLMSLLILGFATSAGAQTLDEYYFQVMRAREAEQREIQNTEMAEEKAIAEAGRIEQQKRELQDEILKIKLHIEKLQSKQDRAYGEIDGLKIDLANANEELNQIQKEAEIVQSGLLKHTEEAEAVRDSLAATKKRAEADTVNTKKIREELQSKMQNMQISMAHMRTEIAKAEADIARAENEKVKVETEYMRVTTETYNLKARHEQINADRERLNLELMDTQMRLKKAQEDYRQARGETEKAEKESQALQKKTELAKNQILNEMKNLEQSVAQTRNLQARADADRARYQAEIDRLQQDMQLVKQKYAEVTVNYEFSRQLASEDRVRLENTRSELARELAAQEVGRLNRDTRKMQARTVASVETGKSVGGLHMNKPVMVVMDCDMRKQPDEGSEVVGKIFKGDKPVAADLGNGFYKVSIGSGTPAYVPTSCLIGN